MNVEKLRKQLEIDEGVVYEIYLDHLNLPTFGIGHLVLKSDPEHSLPVGTQISEERVIKAFENDFNITLNECKILYPQWDELPEEVKQVLANMLFNVGRPRLTKFAKMNAAIAAQDWKTAAKEGRDSLWYRQVTNRAERLMSRLENVGE